MKRRVSETTGAETNSNLKARDAISNLADLGVAKTQSSPS